jgi:hypothetical protein
MYVATRVPLVLSIALPKRLSSARFKQVVHPAPANWMHHLELRDLTEIDDEVPGWLAEGWTAADRTNDPPRRDSLHCPPRGATS